MTRGKRIAVVLGAVGAVLALLVVAQQAGLGRGYELATEGDRAPTRFPTIEAATSRMPEFSAYGEIVSRPVFNESRAPEAIAAAPTDAEAAAPAASPLNVTLTGVMLLPNLQLAFVRDNVSSTVQRVRVGTPLAGEQSGWKLVELRPRGAVFEGEGLGRQEIELATDTAGAPAATPPVVQPQPQPAGVPGQPQPVQAQAAAPNIASPAVPPTTVDVPPPAASNAEDIRRRIEERRRQLREEAQRMQDQNQQ